MRRSLGPTLTAWLAAGILLLGPASCKETNPDFDGPASSGTSTSSDGSSTGPVATTDPMTTSGMEGSGSTSLPPGTTDDTMPPLDTGSSDPSMGGSSSSGGDEPLYPPCMLDADPVCPRPHEECYEIDPDYTVCTLPCQDDADCPQAASGDAQPECAGPGGDQCVLDCSDGETCPDGMECQQGGGNSDRCVWPA
jgi:hypothetical protein